MYKTPDWCTISYLYFDSEPRQTYTEPEPGTQNQDRRIQNQNLGCRIKTDVYRTRTWDSESRQMYTEPEPGTQNRDLVRQTT